MAEATDRRLRRHRSGAAVVISPYRRLRARVRLGWLILAVVLVAASLLLLGVGAVYATYTRDLPSVEGFGTANLSQVTRIYASDGKTLLEERYLQNRTVVPLDLVSHGLQDATIAIEDREFYSHSGVNYSRILSAGIYDLTHRRAAQGASTITEQVVKRLAPDYLAQQRTIDLKVKELILATQLESRFSKRRILEMYLNSIYYGHGAYGIEAASQTYFHLHAKQLPLAESSFLAGIPQTPSRFDPMTPAGFAATRARQHDVLQAMVAAGYITQPGSDAAFAKDLAAEIAAAQKLTDADLPRTSVAPHFVDYVISLLRQKYGAEAVDRGGLTVITTLDPHAQQLALTATRTEVAAVAKVIRPGVDPVLRVPSFGPNTGAMVVVSPLTGAILAMVGSPDYNDKSINGSVNNTVFIPGQPGYESHVVGSSFKPYTYATALANGYTPKSTLLDANPDFKGYPPGQQPADFDGRQLGSISLETSLQQSRNISSMRLFQALGPQRVFATAEALGIAPSTFTCPACTSGVAATLGANRMSMLDHVAAFGAFANGGRRVHTWAIARITDTQGHVLEDHQPPKREQAIPAEVAYALTSILKGALKPAGWSISIPYANKSGTSDSWKDSWYVGYTTDLAVGVWMAHVDAHGSQAPQNVVYGENGAGLMLRDFMRDWYHGSVPPDFVNPGIGPSCVVGVAVPAKPTAPSALTALPRAPYQYPDPATLPSPTPTRSLPTCPSPVPSPSPVASPTSALPTSPGPIVVSPAPGGGGGGGGGG